MKPTDRPFLVLAYIGSSSAMEKLLTPRTAAKRYPKLFRELLAEMQRQDGRQPELWDGKEIELAHAVLTELGVDKERWSLAGRIDQLLALAWKWSPQDWREKLRKRRLESIIELEEIDGNQS